MMKISSVGIESTAEQESFVPFWYDDMRPVRGAKYGYKQYAGGPIRGTLTIGFGHTDAAKHSLKYKGNEDIQITKEEAYKILDVDMDECEADVNRLVKVPLTQGQFDCLAMFTFNAGGGALAKSTLLRKLNNGDYAAVPDELMKYIYTTVVQNGKKIKVIAPGLKNRRRPAEIALWNSPSVDDPALDEEIASGGVLPVEPPGPKPLTQSKTLWGAICAFFAGIVQEITSLLSDYGSYLNYISKDWAGILVSIAFILMFVGLIFVVWGRLDLRNKHGV